MSACPEKSQSAEYGFSYSGFFVFCCILILFTGKNAFAQSGGFELQTYPNVDFIFNTLDKYENGIIIPHVVELKVNTSGAQWDLYMGTTTTTAGSFNVTSTYSNVGISPPPVSLIQARVYNAGSTQQTGGGFFPLTDVALPVYLIGSSADDLGVSCGDPIPTGTNEPGDYITSPSCYKFSVDLKIVPGFNYRPGMYTARVDFYIIEDL
jgi:hypothetical protein